MPATPTGSLACWPRVRTLLAATAAIVGSLLAGSAARAAQPQRFVQRRFFEVTSGVSVSVALRRPTTAGNLLVALVVWDNGGAVSLTDDGGNVWASAIGPTQAPGDSSRTQVFYATGIVGGSDTVMATFSTAITTRGVLYVHEYSGLDRMAPLDTTLAASGTSAAMDSGLLTTSLANELVFVGAESNGRAIRRLRGYRVRSRKYGNAGADTVATAAGPYRATATQLGTSWVMQLVAFRPAFSTPPSTAYPLKVGATGRYLVDQNDTPFLIMGDSPQALMVNLSEGEADAFFADRQAAGYNVVWINLLCATYTGGRADGSTYDGIVPFTTPGDLATPNPSYFARVDDMLNLAAQHGLTVLLDPAETGSFLSVLNDNGVAKARDYGRFLGSRYRSFDNIVWMSGNDFQSWQTAGDDDVVQAVARGIQDTDNRHIHTVELDYPVSGSLDDASWAPLIQLNASYTYYPTYAQVLADYDRPDALPTFLVEANYEFEHNAGDEGTPEILRRQAYWSLLSGAAGQLYGNRYTWPFIAGWESNLDTPGSAQMTLVQQLFAPRPWYNLVPDQDHSVVTAGFGTFATGGALGDSDYATAARTPDGALVMAYMPTPRTLTLDMSKLGSSTDASWYDPTDGTFVPIAGSPFANTGSHAFAPPAGNHGDWVLVLEASALPPDTEPPSVPTGLAATAVSSSQIAVSWTASHDDVGVAGYRLYRGGVLIKTTTTTSYTDAGLAPLTAYSYTVAAFDFAGNPSAQSAPAVATTAAPSPSFMQQAYATPQSPQSAVAATFAGAQATGDTNILAIGWNDVTSSISSVVDAAGNVYQPAIATYRGSGLSQAIYFASSIHASAAGGNQVTVTFDQPAAFVDLRITEYSGVRSTSPVDAAISATGTGTTAATSVTTTKPADLLFAAGMTSAVFTGPGAGFVSRVITAPDGDIVEDAEAPAAGSHAAAAPLSGGTWVLQVAAFVATGQ